MKDYYLLCYSNRKFKITEKYNIFNAKIGINKKFIIEYREHCYKKENNIFEKIKRNELNNEKD